MREVKKWGFGAAPFKYATDINNRKALIALQRYMLNESDSNASLPDAISHVKGMFNRILKQDQWDWFTTNMYFDYPNLKEIQGYIGAFTDLRKALVTSNTAEESRLRSRLLASNLITYIDNYLNYDPSNDAGDEFVYILSRKEEKELLKNC